MEKNKNFRIESIKLRQKKESLFFNKKTSKFKEKKSKIIKRLSNSFLFNKLLLVKTSQLELKKYTIKDSQLPASFHDFKILFISDLHLDIKPNSIEYIKQLNLPKYDLLVLGGDLFDKPVLNKQNTEDFESIFNLLKTNINISILGNHDSINLTQLEKNNNIRFLVNESISIKINQDEIVFTGIDDITSFTSKFQEKCLSSKNKFKICLSHNPDFLCISEKFNYNLQLSGHTHGGQFKLPFNYVLFPHTKYKFAISGYWNYKKMQGITSSGFGCSTYPIRNINPEIVFITLKNE